MKYISIDYILKLHEKLILATGGLTGIRDMELLKSAIETQKQHLQERIYIKVLKQNALIFVTVS
ncbi:MAG: hypothetical protein QME35_09970 [Thermoanaerobacteraceae bacterium]|nr:hypothetical protein [Thermoanaerobacteraceae bacterium]